MAEMELLDSAQHAALRVSTAPDAGRHFVQLVAEEFLDAALHYPILFARHPETGDLYPGALMGLVPDENLCLAPNDALAGYRPADLERQGFYVSGENIAIDRDHAALAQGQGDPVFEMDGGAAPALRRVQAALRRLHVGLPQTEAFIQRMMAHKLVEPIDLNFQFDNGESLRLDSLYTLGLDTLHALPDEVALTLFRSGDLQLVYAITGSVRHLPFLARRRNDRLSGLAR
ncbi:SapC family protein [Sphingomonas sanguinis]|uniref:SapC family protein n=1 Tax=Sphingomonas sp. LC-1 TaxID=3110957 RepID=UPI0021BAB8B0|nr:SapC family protein [Sphingomonas sp. LC-1]MCT8000447.1 SapC family protein [Sphingomonas sp. LC-1]